jgi:hypothetical protein
MRVMNTSDAGYNYDRYRRLLAEATNEQKRLALINLLIEEKAKDRLAEQQLHARLLGLMDEAPAAPRALSMEKALLRKSPQPLPTSFAKVSRKPIVRLNTGCSGDESRSRTK